MERRILYISLNNEFKRCYLGTDRGFEIYSAQPFECRYRADLNRSIRIVECYRRTNIFALVDSAVESDKVLLWNDATSTTIGEISCFGEITGVRFAQTAKLVVSTSISITILTRHRIVTPTLWALGLDRLVYRPVSHDTCRKIVLSENDGIAIDADVFEHDRGFKLVSDAVASGDKLLVVADNTVVLFKIGNDYRVFNLEVSDAKYRCWFNPDGNPIIIGSNRRWYMFNPTLDILRETTF